MTYLIWFIINIIMRLQMAIAYVGWSEEEVLCIKDLMVRRGSSHDSVSYLGKALLLWVHRVCSEVYVSSALISREREMQVQ
jgi:hypothetical protein